MRRNFAIAAVLAGGLALSACSGNVFELEVGQCFDDPDSFEQVSDVPIVDCAEPHDNEVYRLFDMPDGSYPGDGAVQSAAEDGCIAAFQGYVGIDYLDSRLVASWLTPTSDSWSGGDREIVCFLFDIDLEKLEGSMQGAQI